MIIRANSFRSVLVDGSFLVAAMTIVALAATFVYSQEDGGTNTLSDTPPPADYEAIDSRLNTDDNRPSGDPTESEEAANQSLILGMKVEADEIGRAIVTEVPATSPAWNAGIREGDEIVELHSLRPGETDFSKWSQDLRRLLRDTESGQAVSVEVSRDGERLSLRVKLPESRVAEVRAARQQEQEMAELVQSQRQMQVPQGQGQAPQAAPYGPGWGGGVGVIADDGTAAAGANNNRAATNAVAELFATDTLGHNTGGRPANVQGQATGGRIVGQIGQGGRVGMAVFQNSEQGVAAHVEVTGLPQGRYRVGIGDSSGIGFVNPFDDSNAGQMPDDETPLRDDVRLRPDDRRQSPMEGREQPPSQQPFGAPNGQQPPASPAPAPGNVPGSGGAPDQSSSLAAPGGAAYLAQQLGAQPGQVGNVGNPAGAATQNPNVNPNALRGNEAINQPPLQAGDATQGRRAEDVMTAHGMDGNMPGFLMEIGMLEVGIHGAGQVQNQLEGVTVQNLAGMLVMVVPAVPREAGGLGTVRGGQQPPEQAAVNPNADQTRNPAATGNQAGAAIAPGGNTPLGDQGLGPVAVGTIRIVEGSGLPRQTNDAWEQGLQESEEANRRQREELQRRNPIAPPYQTFDPNQPRNR